MGGHSDICAGAVASTEENMERIFQLAKNLGGSLSDYTVWLLERSIKTMGIRVKAQNTNAQHMAEYLEAHSEIGRVYYPGLPNHPGHTLAKKQMRGFGGIITVLIKGGIKETATMMEKCYLFALAESLGGIESLINHPAIMTHASVPVEQRAKIGITDNLVRLSVCIEDVEDLIAELDVALG